MLIGADFERVFKLSHIQDTLERKFTRALFLESDSLEAFYQVKSSRSPVSIDTMRKATRGMILNVAGTHAVKIASELADSSSELASTSEKKGDIISSQGITFGADGMFNPSLKRYRNYAEAVLEKASRIAINAVLVEIENGDPGLAQLFALSRRSLDLISLGHKDPSLENAHIFNTQIPGLSFGIAHQNSGLPTAHFILHHLHSHRTLVGGLRTSL